MDISAGEAEEHVRRAYNESLSHTDYLSTDNHEERRMREMYILNLEYFMATLLDRKDRMSMANGLEVRVPFCDYRIVEYAYNIPWSMKAWGGREKGLVRHAMQGILPDDVLWRKKSPYPKTHNPVYMELCKKKIKEILGDKNRRINSLIDASGVREIMEHPENIRSPWYGQLMKAPQILAYLIEVDYWLESYKAEIELP